MTVSSTISLNCRHCADRLRANATASICRHCRLRGHREFGKCGKCVQPAAMIKKIFKN